MDINQVFHNNKNHNILFKLSHSLRNIFVLTLSAMLIAPSVANAEQIVTVNKASALDMQLTGGRLYIKNLKRFNPDLPDIPQPPIGCCAGPFIDITTTGGDQMYTQILERIYSNQSITFTLPDGSINRPILDLTVN